MSAVDKMSPSEVDKMMAERRAKCSLRVLLERQLDKVVFTGPDAAKRREKAIDDIMVEVKKHDQFRRRLEEIEKVTNIFSMYLQLQYVARLVDYVTNNMELFGKDGRLKYKDYMQDLLSKAAASF